MADDHGWWLCLKWCQIIEVHWPERIYVVSAMLATAERSTARSKIVHPSVLRFTINYIISTMENHCQPLSTWVSHYQPSATILASYPCSYHYSPLFAPQIVNSYLPCLSNERVINHLAVDIYQTILAKLVWTMIYKLLPLPYSQPWSTTVEPLTIQVSSNYEESIPCD